MDSNNWRPTQGGEPAMDAGDWRSQLQPDSRQRIVNKIMDTLKKHLPVSGQEGLHELRKIAVRFEETIYTAASSQSDYLRKISLKILIMETKSQNSMASSLPSSSMVPGNKPPDSASLDSTAQTGQGNGGDWQEEIYQKIKAMKELYFVELIEMYQKIGAKVQHFENLPQQPKSEQLHKLKAFKTILERLLAFLQVSKNNILPGFKDKIGQYEKQIVSFLHSNRPRNPVSSLQPGQLPASHIHPIQQSQAQMTPLQSPENQINPLHSGNMQGSVASVQQNCVNNLQHNSLSSF